MNYKIIKRFIGEYGFRFFSGVFGAIAFAFIIGTTPPETTIIRAIIGLFFIVCIFVIGALAVWPFWKSWKGN